MEHVARTSLAIILADSLNLVRKDQCLLRILAKKSSTVLTANMPDALYRQRRRKIARNSSLCQSNKTFNRLTYLFALDVWASSRVYSPSCPGTLSRCCHVPGPARTLYPPGTAPGSCCVAIGSTKQIEMQLQVTRHLKTKLVLERKVCNFGDLKKKYKQDILT